MQQSPADVTDEMTVLWYWPDKKQWGVMLSGEFFVEQLRGNPDVWRVRDRKHGWNACRILFEDGVTPEMRQRIAENYAGVAEVKYQQMIEAGVL